MSHIQPQTQSAPARAPSAASQISSHSMSGHESRQSHNGSAPEHGGHPHHQFDQRYQPNRYQAQHQHHPSSSSLGYEYDSHSGMNHQTPQPHPAPQYQPNGHPFPNADPSAYLPSITSSPPPHAPLYVPPPQHAMPPDPIHMQMGGWQGMPPQQHMNGVHPGWRPTNPYLPVSQGYRNGSQGQHPMTTGLDSEHEGHSVAQSQPYPSRGGLGSMPPPPLPHHPAQSLYKSNPMMMPNGSIRSGSSHGEGREKRRDRSSHYRDEDGERDDEVISTIFVVGFPDDMDEREFQNLFTFAPGFEAATLKFPSGSQRREPAAAAALLAELTQLAAQQQAAAAAALASGEQPDYPLQTPLEEAIAALQLSGSTSSSTTPSAAMSMTPSAPSGPMFGNMLPQLPNRRQTIGFARFKTRQDAITARELLQGRKIDALTGATLKAEMAKKNLHTKKATSGEELVSLLLKSGRLAGYVGNAGAAVPSQTGSLGPAMVPIGGIPGVIPPPPAAPSSARDVWDSWSNPQALLSPTASGLGGQTVDRSIGPEQSYPYRSGQYPASTQPTQSIPQQSTTQTATSSTSPSASVQSPNARPSDSKALLALAEEADELEGWSVGGSVGISMTMDGFSNSATTNGQLPGSSSNSNANRSSQTQPGPNSISQPARRERERSSQSNISSNVVTSPILSPNSISQNQQANNMTMYGRTSDYIGSPNELSGGESGRSLSRVDTTGSGGAGNPADQNPPINTLYVGNLPAISPPTHPPNFLEESLRALFARCPGFKRMSFRQKINGPMCFVEYEDVSFAAQAIKDLYGHNLGGLVKGGIRLSYSKNSLGQRGSMHPAGLNTSMFGGIAHTVALAGMSSPSSANANSNTYGLQLSHVQGHGGSQITPGLGGQGPHSAPIPMPGDLRRTSDATTLSPNAQPFNASLPVATSPRSRYYGSSPGAVSSNGGAMSATSPSFSFAPGSLGAGGSSGASSSNGSGGSNGTTTQPIPTPGAGHHSGSDQFSPVASPIRTPQSYSWVSSGARSQGGAVGNGGYGFDPFSPHSGTGLSLGGAASAWSNHGGNSGSTAAGAGGHS